MKTACLALTAALLAAACGEPEPEGPVPVKDVPLEGVVDGRPFVARSATAEFFDAEDEDAFVTIYDEEVGCDTFAPSGDRQLLTTVPWKAGTAYDFGLQRNMTFSVKDAQGDYDNRIVTRGRLEVIDAPREPGLFGTIRLRGSFGSGSSRDEVEGSISVEVCP